MESEVKSEFSELVMLYCENLEIVKTLERKWRTETDKLVQTVKEQISDLKINNIELYLTNTYASIKKKGWVGIQFWIGYDPGRIGKNTIGTSIQIKNRDLRIRVCEELKEKIKMAFGQDVNPKREFINYPDKEVIGYYADAIVDTIRKFIEFIPHLEPYANKGT